MWGLPEWFTDSFLRLFLISLVLLLIWVAQKILGSELHHFMEAFRSEISEASKRAKTVGAINWYGLVVVGVFGVLVIVASTGQKLLGLSVALFIGEKKANELSAYSNYTSMFFFLGAVMVVSLICVVIDNRNKKD
jgi:uncharacterized membrane protein YidH (DUF202 family)